jgi:hypothetical protein
LLPETLSTIQIPVDGIKTGVYVLRVKSGAKVISSKVIIQK